MKKLYILTAMLLISAIVSSQDFRAFGGEYKLPEPSGPCVSPELRQQMRADISQARATLDASGNRHAARIGGHPLFIWPVVNAPSSPYNHVWAISNHVDHNAGFPNQLLDYNCGTRTYDTAAGYNHAGVDIFTWPFTWYQFENDQAHVVAAADGMIIFKNDGLFDMSCAMNGNTWNAVYVEHGDGSISVYGHLKKESLTTKAVGETVSAGEYLGVVGSSGNSSGPHLHFEVFDASDNLVDPYMGTCNTWESPDSWWIEQKEYYDPKINAVFSHTAPPQFLPCPQTEIHNLSNDFDAGSTVYAAIYLSDQLPGTTAELSLTRPNGTVLSNWTYDLTDFYSYSHWYWVFGPDYLDQSGTWTFALTYQGETVSHQFNYVSLGTDANTSELFSVYPNPATDMVHITAVSGLRIISIDLYDMVGKQVMRETDANTVDLSRLSDGIYLLEITSDRGRHKSKIIKN